MPEPSKNGGFAERTILLLRRQVVMLKAISFALIGVVNPAMDGHDEVFVTIDGQSGHPLEADDVIAIQRADRPLRLVRAATRTYFEVLREKLKWSQW